ncbi:MAG: NAD(+)/NADH kinase [Gemmatimonadaceae bacterium]
MSRVGVVGNVSYDGLPAVLATLRRRAPELGMTLLFEDELWPLVDDAERLTSTDSIDALVTLGGDGTMLRGARLIGERHIPILGINLGRLGFLTACGGDELERAVERLATGDYIIQPRMALDAHSPRPSHTRWRALNDIVLHKGGFARVVHLRVSVNAELIGVYAADGIIISSPTGSTAYNLSAGGPVVVPSFESIVVTPISPHTLAVRPVVLPPDSEITVKAEDGPEELLVTVDGQVGAMFTAGDTLHVERSDRPVLIVRFRDYTFFSRMRRKLGWGGHIPRDEGEPC